MRTTHHHFQSASVRCRVALAHGVAPREARHRTSLPDGCGGPDRSRRDHESGRLGDERHEACHESEGARHRVLLVFYRSLSSKTLLRLWLERVVFLFLATKPRAGACVSLETHSDGGGGRVH